MAKKHKNKAVIRLGNIRYRETDTEKIFVAVVGIQGVPSVITVKAPNARFAFAEASTKGRCFEVYSLFDSLQELAEYYDAVEAKFQFDSNGIQM